MQFFIGTRSAEKKCHLQVHQGLVAKVLSEPVDVGVVEVPHGHGALRVELLHGLSVHSGLPVSHRDHVGHQVVGAHVAVDVVPKQGRKGNFKQQPNDNRNGTIQLHATSLCFKMSTKFNKTDNKTLCVNYRYQS